MYIPRDFGDPVANFWNLVNAATLSDVAVERQVEITGPDAAGFKNGSSVGFPVFEVARSFEPQS